MVAIVVSVAFVFVLVLRERSTVSVLDRILTQIEGERQAWTLERQELLNRVQAPERIPLPNTNQKPRPDPEPDEIGVVGTVST